MSNIKTEAIKKELAGKEILKGIDVDFPKGLFTGIIGPNGSGKSTFLKCLYRVLKPESGAIYLNHKELKEIAVKDSAKEMAVVSQHHQYNFDFSVEEMVLMGRAPYKKFMERDSSEDFAIVNKALEQVGMVNYKDRSFSSLSGGEQQRIILARALAQKTELLILDEPTNHLDIRYQIEFMTTVKNLGVTVISAIHDLNLAAMYCDKIYVMEEGQIVASGSPKEVITSELIEKVYKVKALVREEAETGLLNIIYRP